MDIKEYISSGIIESYVLGLASEEEISILTCISKNNPEVQQAIVDAQMTLELLADAQAMETPTKLKDSIWSKITDEGLVKEESQDQQSTSTTLDNTIKNIDHSITTVDRPLRYQWAIAASVLLAVSIGTNLYLYWSNDKHKTEIAAVISEKDTQQQTVKQLHNRIALLQDSDVKKITLKGVENKPTLTAVVFWNQKTAEVYLSLDKMPPPPQGKQYQLWAMVDGKPIDAGVFPLDSKAIELGKMTNISKAQAFAITLEDEGGKPTPTLSELCVIGSI